MIKKVLAIGAGTMGSQASFYYAMNGYDVTQYDISDAALDACRKHHRDYVAPYRAARPSLSDHAAEAGLARIQYSSDLEAAARDADLVTESAPEVLEIKQQIYADLARFSPEHTIFTTNTSTLAPSVIAPFSGRPDRFLAMHYAPPMWERPIAEVMRHPETDETVFEEVLRFAKESGLVPIRIEREQPGYLVNTMLIPWLFASLSLVVTGVSTYRDVDRSWMIINHGNAPGPMGILDQVGFEVSRNIGRLLAAAEPDNPLYPQCVAYLEDNFIAKGYTGVLSGRGFYSYPDPEYLDADFLVSSHV
ncbi:3-hydroxyacyl-CoA dehydrogenase NAD-binding domain-containing protein [Congregibacter sp.]|uniref:3-hydroxyacyl-CoA dehydrogenase NAD-binding domain-containing protein n=1 Tax=Congregibacter sp. TaxID=2744308 RepID=UPI003F6A5A1B